MKVNLIFSKRLGHLMSLSLCAAALSACFGLPAQTTGGNGGPRKPPAEALASCKALSTGADCSFTGPNGAVKGTCWAPEGKPLACKPKDAPAGGATPPKP